MRAQVNNLSLLLRPPVNYRNTLLVYGRRLHSDTPSVAAVRAVPAVEPRPPLTDLLGRRHNYLRISLTERCNLRCQYCMPAEGVPLSPRNALLSREELSRTVRTFAALGVDKVRLTGGEPTLRKDLVDIIQDISSVPGIRGVSMTTNGLVLTRRLVGYQRAGLSAINVSLDSLQKEKYEHMARRPGLSRVLAGVDLALQLGYSPVKINVVLMKGFNDDEICDFVEYTRDRDIEVRFIEFMPFTGNAWDDSKLVPHRAAVRALMGTYPAAQPTLPRPNDTARVWQVPGYKGSVGFISSMTKNFCSTCNRLRLTADGNLKVCLFGASEVSLRDAMRSGANDQEMEDLIRTALRNKKPQHAAVTTAATTAATLTPRAGLLRGSALLVPPTSLSTPAPATDRLYSPEADATPTTFSHLDPARTPRAGLLHSSALLVPLPSLHKQTSVRLFSSEAAFSHLDSAGRARMVDVGDKDITQRTAAAQCELRVGARLLRLLKDANLPKGDALTVAQIAGVMGAKKTSDLIPMCHPLPLDCARVAIQLPRGECAEGGDIAISCEVRATARTGAEMEALTGAAVAALALYDMCKAVDKNMRVMNLRVVRKSGGRSGEWPREAQPEIKVRDHDTSKHQPTETYAPTTIMHF